MESSERHQSKEIEWRTVDALWSSEQKALDSPNETKNHAKLTTVIFFFFFIRHQQKRIRTFQPNIIHKQLVHNVIIDEKTLRASCTWIE